MTERTSKILRAPTNSAGGVGLPPNPAPSFRRRTPCPLRRPKRRKPHLRLLSRSSSEPILWTVHMAFSGDGEARGSFGHPLLPRLHTCTDVFSPSPWPRSPSTVPRGSMEEAKVLVSVAVEGSPGPVRAMVRLGASVEEAIVAVVEKYGSEGRSPRLDRGAVAGFELHHSHFSLQSLNKSDKIGEVGSRSFYLCTNTSSHSFTFGREAIDSGISMEGGEIDSGEHGGNALVLIPQLFFSTIGKRLKKIKRRTKNFWNVVTGILCG